MAEETVQHDSADSRSPRSAARSRSAAASSSRTSSRSPAASRSAAASRSDSDHASPTGTRRSTGAAETAAPSVAVNRAVDANSSHFEVPFVGRLRLPPPQHLAFYAAIGILAAVEIIEWPVAVLIAAGKALADSRSNNTFKAVGEALEDVTG